MPFFPARHPRKSLQHVRECAAGDGAICSKNRKIVPYHGANPRLRSPFPIMAPDFISDSNWTEWSTVRGVIARVISKSDEREARGRFEITSTITS